MTETTYEFWNKWTAIVSETGTRFFNPKGKIMLIFPIPAENEQGWLEEILHGYKVGFDDGVQQGIQTERRRLRAVLGVDD